MTKEKTSPDTEFSGNCDDMWAATAAAKDKETKKPTLKRPVNPDRVAVLETHVGERLIIRSNPTQKAVREFVEEQNRRHYKGEPGGPSGLPAFHVHEANYYPSEADIDSPQKAKKIKL